MEVDKKKCSLQEHNNTNAIIYCESCKVYMCNKCENLHTKLFPYHKVFKSDKDINEIFIAHCQEEGHYNKLEYFCKSHNQLCCAACIAKIKKNQNGKHKDCEVCIIEDIKEEKKNKIKENIKYLEEFSNSVQNSIQELKNIYNTINDKKEEIKLKIQQVFTKLRNELNNREDKLLTDVDQQLNIFDDEKLIRKCDSLPEKIKKSLDVVKNIDKEGNNDNIIQFINDCVNTENNIKDIIDINEKIKANKEYSNIKIKFYPEDELIINKFLESINNFGEVKKDDYKEIENPWSNERFKYRNIFYYTLKNNNYIAEKTTDNSYIHLIKSSYKFKKDKKYKLIFIPVINSQDDFDIGFADFEASNICCCLQFNHSVGVTNEGLIINNSNINSNLKIENGKKYEFLIDISQNSFTLNINNEEKGNYNFNFSDNIYAHAAIRNVGNSVSIKTYEK